jgi:hypothetical protein
MIYWFAVVAPTKKQHKKSSAVLIISLFPASFSCRHWKLFNEIHFLDAFLLTVDTRKLFSPSESEATCRDHLPSHFITQLTASPGFYLHFQL